MNKEKDFRVLMELWPAGDGFSGIPQETRLLFSLFCDLPHVKTTGLLQHYSRQTSPGLKKGKTYNAQNLHKKIHQLSRHIISYKELPVRTIMEKLLFKFQKHHQHARLALKVALGIPEKITTFEAKFFHDFIWQRFFSKTLSVSDYEKVLHADFAILMAAWSDMQYLAMGAYSFMPMHVKVDTRDYDVLIAQAPSAAVPSPNTQLVLHYQDAVPVFLPHVIPDMSTHARYHYLSLLNCYKQGSIFACASECTRQDLLRIFPGAEKRSLVTNDIVSHNYFQEQATRQQIIETIRSRIEPLTEPRFNNAMEKDDFYIKHVDPKKFRYIMTVCTIEPRKNHNRIIGAWEMLRARLDPELKLIFIGSLGWDNDSITSAMRPWQERGQLFHLSKVPSGDLRALYNGAEAVVCASIAEGFDYCGVEAMLCGGAVVASSIPVHREIYSDEACSYFNPYSTKDCSDAIARVIDPQNTPYRSQLIATGLKHAQRYRKGNIAPRWENLMDRIKAGDYKKNSDAHTNVVNMDAIKEAIEKSAIAAE